MKYPQPMKTIFQQDFEGPLQIAKASGTVTGSPVIRDGLVLDGTNDYVTYSLPNTVLGKAELSFVVEFIPDFQWDEAVIRTFFVLGGSASNCLVRWNSSNFRSAWGGYAKYYNMSGWEIGQKCTLVSTMENGSQALYLNGSLLGTDTQAMAVVLGTDLAIGGNYGTPFKGTIKSFSIHNRIFTASEAQAVYDNSLFNFENKASVWLDMKSSTSDGINRITLDRSGKGNSFLLGDGTTASTQPAFSGPGFDFDGSSDYMLNDNSSGILNNAEQSIVLCFKPYFHAGNSTAYYLLDATTGSRYLFNKTVEGALIVYLGNTLVINAAISVYGDYWLQDGINTLVVSGESGNTDLYLNGVKIVEADNSVWTPSNPTELYLGSNNANTNVYDGTLYHFSTYPFKLSPIQVEHLTNKLNSEYK